MWNPGDDDASYTYGGPHACRLRNGTLLLVAQRLSAEDEYPSRVNPETGGIKPTDIVLLRSHDEGRSWTRPEVLDLPDNADRILDTPSAILEMSDGRWFLACERWKAWRDPAPLHIRGFAVFSDDQGNTWRGRVDFPSAGDSRRMYSHSRYAKMLDGRIAACQWTQSVGGKTTHDLHFVNSDMTGSVWTHPTATGIPGQNSWIADLGEDVIVAVYASRDRADIEPGVRVVLSEDGGRTWNLRNQVLIWDALQNFIGQTHHASYPSSHDNIAFGKVHAVRLADSDVLCSWWCTQACVVHMRYARLRIAAS